MICILPLNAFIAGKIKNLQISQKKDDSVKIMNEKLTTCFCILARISSFPFNSFFVSICSVLKLETTLGEIVNLMSVDVQRATEFVQYTYLFWSAPMQIGLAHYFLWGILGPSFILKTKYNLW